MGRPGQAVDPALCQGLGHLLARSLREAVERGLAFRAANAETLLEQYRETALLRRVATTLNQSLYLPEVTHAVLAECAGGPAQETPLHLIVESTLFKEVMAEARDEIVNDLVADPRWRVEVPGLVSLLSACPFDHRGIGPTDWY